MGIWFHNVVNLTGVSMGIRRSMEYKDLDSITNSIDTPAGFESDKYTIYTRGDAQTTLNAFDAGSWDLKIVLTQAWKEDLVKTWRMSSSYNQCSFVFDNDKIWFYTTDISGNSGGAGSWVVRLYDTTWEWEPYNVQPN